MELEKNQCVLFENGRKEGYLEARWSEKYQSFITWDDDGNEMHSTNIIEKPSRKKSVRKFTPSATTCTIQIFPCGEAEKCYITAVAYGPLKGGAPSKIHYEYTAKSICYINEQGDIFKPIWSD